MFFDKNFATSLFLQALFLGTVHPESHDSARPLEPRFPQLFRSVVMRRQVKSEEEMKSILEEKYKFVNDETSRRFKITATGEVETGAVNTTSKTAMADMAFRTFAARRIVGGMETSISVYPYNVAISRNGKHWCGGSIIDEQWILTAGHCMEACYGGEKFKLNPFIVRAGSSFHGRGGYQARLNKVFFPEKYVPGSADYDYSLVRLDRPMPIGRNIAVLNLPSEGYNVKNDDLLIVTGWGSTDESGYGNIPDRLRFVPVPMMSMESCQSSYRFYITPRMLCAGYATGGKDACNHDSGGPAVRDGVLLGVVSFGGKRCGDSRNPGVYSRVSVITPWIEDTIIANEADQVPELQPAINKARKREKELQRFKARVESKKNKIKSWLRDTLKSSAFMELAKKKLLNVNIFNGRRDFGSDGDAAAGSDDQNLDDVNMENLINERIIEDRSDSDAEKMLHALALQEVLEDARRSRDNEDYNSE